MFCKSWFRVELLFWRRVIKKKRVLLSIESKSMREQFFARAQYYAHINIICNITLSL